MEGKILKKIVLNDPYKIELDKDVTVLVLPDVDKLSLNVILGTDVFTIPKEYVKVHNIDCYYPEVSKEDAQSILSNDTSPSAFLLRNHELNQYQFVLSIKWSNSVYQSIDINMSPEGILYCLDRKFETINKLILFYSANPACLPDPRLEKNDFYTRTFIRCGVASCLRCGFQPLHLSLSSSPTSNSNLFPGMHYLIPDSSFVINQMQILKLETLKNVIIPLSVLNEIRRKNVNIYTQLGEIIGDPNRKFFVFSDDKLKETSVDIKLGETRKEMQERTMRAISKWYNTHLNAQGLHIKVFLLTNDENEAEEEGIFIANCKAYISSLTDGAYLLSKMSINNLQDDEVDYEYCGIMNLFLQADAQNDHLAMSRIKDIICQKLPLIAAIHQPHSNYYPASKIKKTFSAIYFIGYDENSKNTDKCQSLILIRKMCVDDFISIKPQINPSFSESILKSKSHKDIIVVCYTSSRQPSADYDNDTSTLRGSLKSRVDPLVAFMSFSDKKLDEMPDFIKKPGEFFEKECKLIPLLSKSENLTRSSNFDYFIFINLWMKDKFVFEEISLDTSKNTYVKIVRKKKE